MCDSKFPRSIMAAAEPARERMAPPLTVFLLYQKGWDSRIGSRTTSAGDSIADSAAAKPRAIGVENCCSCSDSSDRRVCEGKPGKAGEHLDHGGARRAVSFTSEARQMRSERHVEADQGQD